MVSPSSHCGATRVCRSGALRESSARFHSGHAAGQRGINLLDGDPDLDDGASLEVGNTQAAAKLRTRELERRIPNR